ncbi:MAG TPA: UbiA family prenyltransferase [Nocardioidaceae bacterium]|nr:UbiA family prenyltransferase [Nocardioidaceae bacterium]
MKIRNGPTSQTQQKTAKQPGLTLSLVMSSHPLPTAAMTVALTAAAALTGRSGLECALVAATILTGQLTIGWLNDLVDRSRDKQVGRRDKPIAMGWIDPGTVAFFIASAVLLVVPLSIANGTYAGIAHLAAVASAWTYNLVFKKTALSWLPFAVSFGLLPAFLSYGGLGGGMHGSPPTVVMTVLAALLGIGIHFLNALPDLVQDNQTGIRHLPLRLALKTGAPKLLVISIVWTALAAVGIVIAGFTVGLAQ